MAYKVADVAKYMVCAANEMNAPISNLKLQKLLYFAWKDYYKEKQKDLFTDPFEAWQFGPVVRDVYYDYCAYGSLPIKSPLYLSSMGIAIKDEDKEFLRDFLKKYQHESVYNLVERTHRIGGAWYRVFNDGNGIWEKIDYDLIKADCRHDD